MSMIGAASALKIGPRSLGLQDDGRPIDVDEFASATLIPPYRYERAKGRLVVMPPDGEAHVAASEPWLESLIVHRHFHREIVRCVVPNAWVRIDGETDRIGDIGVYLAGSEPAAPIPDAVPDLMLEIVSPGKADRDRDYIEKKAEYHRLGIREYVIIDRFRKTVTVCSYQPEGYDERVLTEADVYESPLLPGFALPLAQAFRDE